MQVIVDNLLISYSVVGDSKKSIMLLHGWADTSDTFSRLSKFLSKNYEIILVDLPGFGASETPRTAWSVLEYSDFISKFLKKINHKPDYIVGHSNGGAIAVNAVGTGRIKPAKLILLASSGVRKTNSVKKQVYKVLAKPAKLALSPLPYRLQKRIKANAYKKLGSDLYAAEHMRETFINIVNFDVTKNAAYIHIPTLLLYGENDAITPPGLGRVLSSAIKNSRLEIIDGAGHFFHQEQPEIIATKIKEFLK